MEEIEGLAAEFDDLMQYKGKPYYDKKEIEDWIEQFNEVIYSS
jgi:hypothetical protein